MQIIIEEEISQFKITMNNVVIMQILDTANNLMYVITTLVVGNGFSALMQFHHWAFLAELKYDVDIIWIVKETMKTDNISVL